MVAAEGVAVAHAAFFFDTDIFKNLFGDPKNQPDLQFANRFIFHMTFAKARVDEDFGAIFVENVGVNFRGDRIHLLHCVGTVNNEVGKFLLAHLGREIDLKDRFPKFFPNKPRFFKIHIL